MDKNAICTVILITYNHAPYIKKAIDSVLEQKTKYGFVIHIFDDASTDSSSDIIREYAKQYPDKIIPFIAEKNRGAQGNIWAAYKSVKTKYCAILETDDCWCDENKLELQIDALERYPECSFCTCNTIIKNIGDNCRKKENKTLMVTNKKIKSNKIITRNMVEKLDYGYMNHLGSRLIRFNAVDLETIKDKETFLYDNCQFLYLLLKGSMYYIDKPMHCYVQTGKGAFSGESIIKRIRNHVKNLINFDIETNMQASQLVYKDIRNFLNYYTDIQKEMVKKEGQKSKINSTIGSIAVVLQRAKRYFLPRFLIDIIDAPFNIIKFISRKIRNKGEI